MKDLKSLTTLMQKAQEELATLDSKIKKLVKYRKDKKEYIERLQRDLKDITSDIVITEHAILRYLERVQKIDIENVKNEILSPVIKKQLLQLNNCKYPVKDFFILVKDNKIVTVLKDEDEVVTKREHN